MDGPHRFVVTMLSTLPTQTVMLDIIGLTEHQPAYKMMKSNQRDHPSAENDHQRCHENQRKPPDLQQLVIKMPEPFAL